MSNTILLPFQPDSMSRAQVAAVPIWPGTPATCTACMPISFGAGSVVRDQPAGPARRDPAGTRGAVHPTPWRLRADAVLDGTMMHGVRGFFRFAQIDSLISSDPAVYARLPKIHTDESRTQGRDRLELIRFLQVARTISVHHGALAYLLGMNALRAPEVAAVRIEDYRETLRGHGVLHLVAKGSKPATMPLTVPVLQVLEAYRGERTVGPLVLRPVSGKPIDRHGVHFLTAYVAGV